jgi:KUP system potassium uptake protein
MLSMADSYSSHADSDSGQHGAQPESINQFLLLALGALGVVFGDIGTSPLYAFRECFINESGIILSSENVLGVLSLIVWTLMAVVSIKYMIFVMRADNRGEGGILSLMALAMRASQADAQRQSRRKLFLLIIGVFGAALLYGDGIITPAISVLSAVEGLKFVTPVFDSYVIPITIFIMNALFLVQRLGTGQIGKVVGPLIMVWFVCLGVLGVHGIMMAPEVWHAIDPRHALSFILENRGHSLAVIGAVFLVVTGGEALYADMGHFGRQPIRFSWYLIALPGLLLNYLGQGALVMMDPEAISNPFYLLAPKWGLVPLVILSTLATITASQALISGAFSITRQAIQLGLCPRLTIIHTSSREVGQIYVPFVNWSLFAGVIWLVLTFKSSSQLASAYGIAVTGTMVITTILASIVARKKWAWSAAKVFTVFFPFLLIDLGFMGANLMKIHNGGWVPLVIGGAIFVLMLTWQRGRKILYTKLKERSVSIEDFCQLLLRQPPIRISGTAVYMAGDPWGVPVPLLHNLKHNKVLHERIAILTIQTKGVPSVPKEKRVEVQEIIPNFYRIIVYYGFMEIPKMKHILDACREKDLHFKVYETTFVLGRETILPSSKPTMPIWQEKIFALMSRNAQRPTAFFRIPPNQVIEVGIQIEI